MENTEYDHKLIEKWRDKFKESMEYIVDLKLQANPNADRQKLKEEYMLEKMATIYVGTMALGRQLRELEEKFNEQNKNT